MTATSLQPAAAETPTATAGTFPEGIEQQVPGQPVTATLKLSPAHAKSGDSLTLSVTLRIAPGWEIHPLDANPDSAATRLELTLPDGLQADESWQAPEPARSATPDGHPVHVGEVVFTRKLVVTSAAMIGQHPVDCRITFTACDERRCLRPQPVTLTVPLLIDP